MTFFKRLYRWLSGAEKARDDYRYAMARIIEHEGGK